jgi:probable rRNA maturation factor
VPADLVLQGIAEAGLDARSVERLVQAVLDDLAVEGACSLSVCIVGDDEMRRLNREHRGLDEVTDVLSFPVDGLDPLPPDMERELGDVVIGIAQARRQAAEAGVPDVEELTSLVVHGVLHLAGFDHETDAGEMFERQDRLLAVVPPVASVR